MTTTDIITEMFCFVDDAMPDLPKHSQAKLYPSEVVTIGILCALKGGYFRAFYRWLERDHIGLFPGLPDRTRLLRLLATHQGWCDKLLADPSFFTVIDSYPIELIFPRLGQYIEARLSWVSAMFNVVLHMFHRIHPDADLDQMSIAEFSM